MRVGPGGRPARLAALQRGHAIAIGLGRDWPRALVVLLIPPPPSVADAELSDAVV